MAPNLYQGGVEAYEGCSIAIRDADAVVLLAPDAGVNILYPEPLVLDLQDARSDLQLAPYLHEVAAELAVRSRSGERVLVLCRQGRNRSGLLTGMVLNELGMAGSRVVRHIKSRRRDALANTSFAKYLARLP